MKLKDKNRDKLLNEYIDRTLDGMDINSVYELAEYYLESTMTDEELVAGS